MASEASLAEQSTDEKIEENKVIDDAKNVKEDVVSQQKGTAGSEIEKCRVEEPACSETSATDSKEKTESKDEASAAEEVKKEDEDDIASASAVLEVKKDDSLAADEVKKENEVSGASSSEALGENNGDTSDTLAVDEVKKENEDSEACGSEVLRDNKGVASDAPAVDEVKKENNESEASGSEVFGNEKGDASDAPIVDELKKENKGSEASGSEVLEDNKGDASDTPAAYEAKKESNESEATGSEVLGDNKGDASDATAVDEVKKESEASQASYSEVLGDNNGDESIVEDVKGEAETSKTSSTCDTEVSVGETEEKSIRNTESLSEEAENSLVDSSMTSVQESEQVGYGPEVSETVVEIAKTMEESTGISTNPDLASEAVAESKEQPVALTVIEPAPGAIGELESKNEISVFHDVVEASKDENTMTAAVEIPCVPLKVESVVEAGASASQAPDTVPGDSVEVEAEDVIKNSASENTEKPNDDVSVTGCVADAMNKESEHAATETSVKEVTVDATLPNPPIAVGGESEAIDARSVTEVAEIFVKPEMNVEEEKGEKTVETELVEEQKDEKKVEEEPVKEQEEGKAMETGPTLTATEETGDQVKPDSEVTGSPSEETKPCEGADKFVEEEDIGAFGSAIKSTGNLEKETSSEVPEEVAKEVNHEDENIEGDATLAQASRDIDLGGQTSETDTSIKEPVVKLEAEKFDVGNVETDETEQNKSEVEKSDAQILAESSKDVADSKTDLEVQKAEASGKPSKTLMSKVKHSIVKVKKAIIGKSPSSKTISAESKDELKVK